MSKVLNIDSLRDTTLWKRLNASGGPQAAFLAQSLIPVCDEASQRMKLMSTYAPQFTLHDESHLLRTTELMALILGENIEILNPVEVALLILGSFFHDQGMVLGAAEHAALSEDADFQLFRDRWYLENPNRSQIDNRIANPSTSRSEKSCLAVKLAEIDQVLLTDYLRANHATKSAEFLRREYRNDKRLEVQHVNLVPFAARLCESHCRRATYLASANGFLHNEQIGTYTANMVYLGVILRLADILDLDRDRTPDVLFRSIHFTSAVSVAEWEKHRCVQGWAISQEHIRFTMRSPHPVYEATARQFMDWVDTELVACHEVCRNQPAAFAAYKLALPAQVDRSRIGPLDNAYRYHELEFKLSRDEIVRLLMTDKLYGQPNLCIRELLQNALDALRHRKALYVSQRFEWADGKVDFEHSLDEQGHEVIRCTDNGTGMDESIITNYLVRVGRSFYRSPEFERERAAFRESKCDFDPCSTFGIGFMSCFMMGDRITIQTRRDLGPGQGLGDPLVVEINGLGGLLVIREGPPDQPVGTTVSVVARKKPSFLDEWMDEVKLTATLKGYALATEFPIHGVCAIEEIRDDVLIPTELDSVPTLLETADIESRLTLEQEFSEIDGSLGGAVRESFLVDEKGVPCLANSEARWQGRGQVPNQEWVLERLADGECLKDRLPYGGPAYGGMSVCVDGILVGGTPGRARFAKDVLCRLGSHNSRLYPGMPALLDVRGELKPELTPARTPPRELGLDLPPGWRRLKEKTHLACARIWEKLSEYLDNGLEIEDFWKLSAVHNGHLLDMRHRFIWERLSVSLLSTGDQCTWRRIRDLGQMRMESSERCQIQMYTLDGGQVGLSSALAEWERQGEKHAALHWSMNALVLAGCTVSIADSRVIFLPSAPCLPEETLSASINRLSHGPVSLFLLRHDGDFSTALTTEAPFPLANRDHPLVQVYRRCRFATERDDLEEFAAYFVPCIAETLSTKEKTPALRQGSYWQKRVAHAYFSVDWRRYDESVKPPYRIWLSDSGWYEFGVDDLAFWRDSAATWR